MLAQTRLEQIQNYRYSYYRNKRDELLHNNTRREELQQVELEGQEDHR